VHNSQSSFLKKAVARKVWGAAGAAINKTNKITMTQMVLDLGYANVYRGP
jgi:hypothetical protein